jgi:transposase
VAALRCEGIDAPCVFDGPINGESFKAYVEQVLAPALRPGDIVVMDNLGSHKGSAIRRAICAAGAHLLFCRRARRTSIRSILRRAQEVFAKLKTLLRKAEERTVDGLRRRIGGLLDAFPPGECVTISKTQDMLLSKSERL